MQELKLPLHYYRVYLKRYAWGLVAAALCVLVFAVANAASPMFLGQAIAALTNMVQHGTPAAAFLKNTAILAALYVTSSFGDWATSMILSWVGGTVTGDMRVGLFTKMQRLPVKYFDTHSDGDILARYTSDLDNIFNAMNEVFVQMFYSFAQFVGALYVMFHASAELAWVTLATTPIAAIIAVINIRKASAAVNLQQDHVGALNGYINEQITGQKVIITNGLQQDSLSGFDRLNKQVASTTLRGQIWSGVLQPLMSGLMLLTTAIVIFVGSWLVLQGSLSTAAALALVVVFVQYAQQYFQPIVMMTSLYAQIQLAITGARRVAQVHEAADEVRPQAGLPVAEVHDQIQVRDVHFSYLPGQEVLHGVSFHAKRGEMVALVGPTGSGKTTIMNLMNRFYDVDSGAVLIDGVDVRQMDLTQLRHTVGIVLQDPQLFSGTIRSNLCFGKPDASEAQMIAAAKQAYIHDYIMSLPQGYDTPLSDEQAVFSAGQKQLLSIARTILCDPQVLIMDEATSNVDTVTEAAIQQAMDNVIAGRTSFVIAHRLKTILNADRIEVLQAGRIIEEGDHASLLAENGFYASLYRNQMIFD
ncbi:ABC transporter ATP-binding protein [Lacticaseibacillus jixiensis]|uniref:ABC transporter ATP-binding protein n=1 Tax=Lacticaseibacillus jixiensis TaxID=3231926 RepID=UPI0036F2C000